MHFKTRFCVHLYQYLLFHQYSHPLVSVLPDHALVLFNQLVKHEDFLLISPLESSSIDLFNPFHYKGTITQFAVLHQPAVYVALLPMLWLMSPAVHSLDPPISFPNPPLYD